MNWKTLDNPIISILRTVAFVLLSFLGSYKLFDAMYWGQTPHDHGEASILILSWMIVSAYMWHHTMDTRAGDMDFLFVLPHLLVPLGGGAAASMMNAPLVRNEHLWFTIGYGGDLWGVATLILFVATRYLLMRNFKLDFPAWFPNRYIPELS